ncbi:predicted protein [Aspergillus nidulans FGSC A4]|uniref:DUF7136 domain-containing protein n=1 Tax=Emericella nidulans (strain FGSC A4 / ATCC 38163 / CBS 112.46 / NRRL 194 / M139) TaxID=227321 RepID=Q5AQC2_EMENI|nr:hypothetical protein [Aspergillus nidulans FGSC A4]EAA66756.1 predicted protein [Aspergillus nidulans FGSC A4]CBF84377.1 TPA: conserved hypothetical protein [Aspergillus nidulans FGSC A4]|eukprot:XP_868890.1 predicted protein [Aspergillus nidulans FGSC A4]
MHSMPVVFAAQNPSAVKELHATIQCGVRPKGAGANKKSNNPAYYGTKYPWVNEADGLNQDAVHDGFHLSSYLITAKYLFFDTEEGATALNLTTLPSDNQCSQASGFVFPPLVSTLDIPRDFPDHSSLPSTCAQFASLTLISATEVSPCRVNISPESERAFWPTECHNTLLPVSGCLDRTTKDDITGRDHGRAAWAAITLTFALIFGLGLVGY